MTSPLPAAALHGASSPGDQPLVGITGRRRVGGAVGGLPPSFTDVDLDLHVAAYATCTAQVGGLPVLLGPDADPVAVVERLDGLVLTGGADVDPSAYGAQRAPEVVKTEPERDAYELALFHAAVAAGLPVLAICRGCQLVNVAMGGTLVQHLATEVRHSAWDGEPHALVHEVDLVPGSLVAQVYGATRIPVNSLHHQAVDRPGNGVTVTARAPDGTAEAVEVAGLALLAVQWHPELLAAQPDPAFSWLVAACRERRR